MKNNVVSSLLLFLVAVCWSYGQLASAPTTEAGIMANAQGGSPMLNLAMADLRAKKNKTTYAGETVGSPYLNEKFTLSKVFYDNEILGDFYIRYNALSSEIEIKESLDSEEVQRLIADKKISVKYGTKELRFTTYINKKKETKNGYLSLINDGENYKLYHRLAIKYVEGKTAVNSMVNDVPSRFAPFVEFYYQQKDVDRIDQLSSRKGKLLNQLKKEHKETAKVYLKENSIDLDKEEDLVTLFTYLNSLD